MLELLRRRSPHASEDHLIRLAEVWSEEVQLIVDRMLELTREKYRALPREARPAAIFELAKLRLSLERKVVDAKLRERDAVAIDPEQERSRLKSEPKIEETAKILADRVWSKLCDFWWQQHRKLAAPSEPARPRSLATRRTGTKRNHFSPIFSNKHWASGPKNLIREYSLGIDRSVRHRDIGYKTWAYESFLYSQDFEAYLGLVEGDAREAYKKLLDMVPLDEQDTRHWVAFLLTQLFRTPSLIQSILPNVERSVRRTRGADRVALSDLRRGYESLFVNNDLFATGYRLMARRRWTILTASASGSGFLRADNPVVLQGTAATRTWRLIYPMTPLKCLVIGPDRAAPDDVPAPLHREISDVELDGVNCLVAAGAGDSVIARISDQDGRLRELLSKHLPVVPRGRPLDDRRFQYWGSL